MKTQKKAFRSRIFLSRSLLSVFLIFLSLSTIGFSWHGNIFKPSQANGQYSPAWQVLTTPGPSSVVFVPLLSNAGMDPTAEPTLTPIVLPPVVGGPTLTPVVSPVPEIDPVINAAGDIAACSTRYINRDGYLQTAALLEQLDGPFLGLGDYAYPDSTYTRFMNCFDPVWGQFKPRSYPALGNHEYESSTHATGYFRYFGAAAGDPALGYYSFDVGDWHIVAINSNCTQIGGCSSGSPQEQWLRADLASHPGHCTLAYWHHPLFSSGENGSYGRMRDIYQALLDYGVDLVLNGHDHNYERFAPQDAYGNYDPVNGITQIIAGTGGKDHGSLRRRLSNSLVYDNTTWGILRLVLRPDGYDFQFVPVAGGIFTDSGSGACH